MRIYPDRSGNGMGAAFVDQVESQGVLTGVGSGQVAIMNGMTNIQLSGTFVATVIPERSLNNGVTWNQLTAGGYPLSFSAPCSEYIDEPEPGAQYRWRCTAYTSGQIGYRISR